jgi:YVTN family beta-propeller protein
VAVNPNTNQIYVANLQSNTVTVIDGATNNTTTVAAGTNPVYVAVNPNTNKIYVANENSNTVTVIDGATNNTTTVAVGTYPYAVAVDPNTNKIYVANQASNTVTVIDGATNNTTTVAVGNGPDAVAVNPNTNMIYVANAYDTVTVIDGATISTTTTLASNLNPSTLNASVTVTATVAENPGTGTPTGTVAFNDGSTTLGTVTLNGSGVATFATSSLAVGQHSITAVYAGDTNNTGSTSSVLTQTVNAAGFTLTFNPTSTTVTAGQSGTFTLTVTPQGAFTNPISFSCSGLPALAGCSFSPASLTPNSSTVTSTLTITTTAHTASLVFPFGRRSRPLYALLLVLPAMLLGTVGMAAPKRRELLSYALVFLLVSGCLLQVACSGASNGSGGGSGGTPAGTYTVTVTGGAGSAQHAAPVTLTVQ